MVLVTICLVHAGAAVHPFAMHVQLESTKAAQAREDAQAVLEANISRSQGDPAVHRAHQVPNC